MKYEQKHLGMILDSARGIGVIRYLSEYVSRDVLDQMYNLYVRPHLDYGDIIYHKVDPELSLDFLKKLDWGHLAFCGTCRKRCLARD